MIETELRAKSGIDVPRRDETAFERQFLAHYDAVYRCSYRIVGDRSAAEDVAQEAFLRLHDRGPRARSSTSVRAWLCRVATNLAYNHVRGRTRRAQRHAAADAEDRAASESVLDPAAEALRLADVESARRALSRLPERQAKLLLLRHSGLSYREVADAVGVASTSVGTLLARAEQAFVAAYRDLARDDEGEVPT